MKISIFNLPTPRAAAPRISKKLKYCEENMIAERESLDSADYFYTVETHESVRSAHAVKCGTNSEWWTLVR